MGGWRLESFKMLGYLAFPIAAFVWFNHPRFYERSLRQTMENMSKDINLENLAILERNLAREGINKLGDTIEEIEGISSHKSKSQQRQH